MALTKTRVHSSKTRPKPMIRPMTAVITAPPVTPLTGRTRVTTMTKRMIIPGQDVVTMLKITIRPMIPKMPMRLKQKMPTTMQGMTGTTKPQPVTMTVRKKMTTPTTRTAMIRPMRTTTAKTIVTVLHTQVTTSRMKTMNRMTMMNG